MGQGKARVRARQHSAAGLGAGQREPFPSTKPWPSTLEVLHSFMLCFVKRRLVKLDRNPGDRDRKDQRA